MRHLKPATWMLPLLLTLVLFCPACNGPGQPAARHHVVLITIDGFPAWLLEDPRTPMPTLQKLMKDGAAALSLHVTNPSITWPTHTSIVTGCHSQRHGVILNGIVTRQGDDQPVKVEPSHDRSTLVKAPTVYDAAYAAGLTTADINWPCTRSAPTLHDSLSDAPKAVQYATPRLRQELIAAGILADATENTLWKTSPPGRDNLWTDAACHVIRARKPNLLLFHLLNVDALNHMHGPGSWAGFTAMAHADACLQRVLDALDQAGIRQQTTILIMGDHGFTATPKTLRPNVLLRKEGLVTVNASGKIQSCRAHVLAMGGVGLVYFPGGKPAEADLKKIRDLFAGKEGFEEILEPDQYAAHHMATPAQNPQMPEMILAAKDGYTFSDSAAGEDLVVQTYETRGYLGYHGHLARNKKMDVPLVISGRGVKKGARLPNAAIVDVAPTVARLLGVKMENVQGRALTELLAE